MTNIEIQPDGTIKEYASSEEYFKSKKLTLPKWISVKDKSPVVNYPVLVTYDMGEGTHRHTDLGRYTGSEWYLYSDRAFVGHPDMRFLAWQELPEPYEGE